MGERVEKKPVIFLFDGEPQFDSHKTINKHKAIHIQFT